MDKETKRQIGFMRTDIVNLQKRVGDLINGQVNSNRRIDELVNHINKLHPYFITGEGVDYANKDMLDSIAIAFAASRHHPKPQKKYVVMYRRVDGSIMNNDVMMAMDTNFSPTTDHSKATNYASHANVIMGNRLSHWVAEKI